MKRAILTLLLASCSGTPAAPPAPPVVEPPPPTPAPIEPAAVEARPTAEPAPPPPSPEPEPPPWPEPGLLDGPLPTSPLARLDPRGIELSKPTHFQPDSGEIRSESFPALDVVVAVLHARPRLGLYLRCIAGAGSREHSTRLAEERAQSLRAYLVAHGVNPRRLDARGVYAPPGFAEPHPEIFKRGKCEIVRMDAPR